MPTAPGYADVSVEMILTGMTRSAYLTFGVQPVDPDPADVVVEVNSAITAAGSLQSRLDAQVTITSIRASVGQDGGADLVYVLGTSIVGQNNVSALPPNCAVLVHKRTLRGGRRGRGRLFIPWCVSETNVDEAGLIATAEVTTIQTAMNVFRTALGSFNVPMVILHNPGLSTMGAPDTVTSLVVDKLLSTQRRRLGR